MDIPELNRLLLLERNCGSCPMLGKSFVGADSWNGRAETAGVLFLGLNPGTEEARAGLPFVGPSGRFLRRAISLAPRAGSWAITNSILCSSPNETMIPDPEACRAFCRGNVGRIWRLFLPKVIAPCGNGAAAVFEIRDGISKAENIWYISRGRSGKAPATIIAPIRHPSALIRSGGASSPNYERWQARINAIFNISGLIEKGAAPETVLEENGIRWKGLFGLGSN